MVEELGRCLSQRDGELIKSVPGSYVSSAVAQFRDERTSVMLGSKFMYGTTGYAGGESELQIVSNLPSPADKDQR